MNLSFNLGRFALWLITPRSGVYAGVRFYALELSTQGVWFPRRGDEVLWVWPWKRRNGEAIVSLQWGGGFTSLRALDRFEHDAHLYLASHS